MGKGQGDVSQTEVSVSSLERLVHMGAGRSGVGERRDTVQEPLGSVYSNCRNIRAFRSKQHIIRALHYIANIRALASQCVCKSPQFNMKESPFQYIV